MSNKLYLALISSGINRLKKSKTQLGNKETVKFIMNDPTRSIKESILLILYEIYENISLILRDN